jgi:hypothetical protein
MGHASELAQATAQIRIELELPVVEFLRHFVPELHAIAGNQPQLGQCAPQVVPSVAELQGALCPRGPLGELRSRLGHGLEQLEASARLRVP